MYNFSAINLLSSERFTAYVRAEEILEQKQNHKIALKSACTKQVSAHANAEAALLEVESLNAKLDALMESTPSVNYELAVDDLLERVEPYIVTNSLVRNFAQDIREAIKLANALGFAHSERGVFSLAFWLQNTVASEINEAQTALDYANDVVATKMTDANSAVQLSIRHSNYLAQLQQQKQQVGEQTNLQREVEKLESRQSKLRLAINELEEWSSTAHRQLYKALNQCFQRQHLTEKLISLPVGLSAIAQEMGDTPAPWELYCQRGLTEVGTLIVKHREWSRVSTVAERIYSLLVQAPPELSTISLTEDAISKTTDAFEIQSLRPVPALEKLHQLAHQTLEQVNRPFHYLWDYNTEPLRGHSRPYCAAAKIKAVKQQTLAIVQDAKPSAIEPALRQIVDETVNSIVTSVQSWLNQTQVEIEQELQRLGKQLNEQIRSAANLQTQILAIQKQTHTSYCEADVRFRRVISLLQEVVCLQQMPRQIRVLAEQYLQNPFNILSQAANFSTDVYLCKIQMVKLEKLISFLDTSAVVSNLRDTVEVEFSNRRDAVQRALKQLTESRIQLREVEAQLQQEFKDITPERAWWEQVWQNIPTHLKPTGSSASLKDKLEAVKIRVSNPTDLYKQGIISAEVYAIRVEIEVSPFVRRLPHYHLRADIKTQNKMRHEYTNYDKLIEVTRGNNEAYMQIKKRVELAIAATQIGSDEYSCEIRAVA